MSGLTGEVVGSSFSFINTGDIDINEHSARKEPMAKVYILTRSTIKASPFLLRTQCGCALVT